MHSYTSCRILCWCSFLHFCMGLMHKRCQVGHKVEETYRRGIDSKPLCHFSRKFHHYDIERYYRDPKRQPSSRSHQIHCQHNRLCRYTSADCLDIEYTGRFRCRYCYQHIVDWGVCCWLCRFFRRPQSRVGNCRTDMSPFESFIIKKVHADFSKFTLVLTQSTLGATLHPPLLISHSLMSTHEKPLPVYPLGHGPQINDPGVLMHMT